MGTTSPHHLLEFHMLSGRRISIIGQDTQRFRNCDVVAARWRIFESYAANETLPRDLGPLMELSERGKDRNNTVKSYQNKAMVVSVMSKVASSLAPLKDSIRVTFSGLHWITKLNWAFLFSITVTWVLFQKKLLPKPVSRVVSKVLFYPTFPITALMRVGNYWTKLDDTLILGCAPMNILGHPDQLYNLGVRGVINMCGEYPGPTSRYSTLGIKQLYLPTVDHYEPSLEFMNAAVAFIEEHQARGEKVYVHCKAAHGRAASIALCWMMKQNPGKTAKELNNLLRSSRKVRKTLFEQPNVKAFERHLNNK